MLIPRRAVPGATEERRAAGRAARTLVPRRSQALVVTDDRPDPVAIIEASNEGRVPALVPVRHGRMGVSAFAFYRGSAAIMAGDLARGPSTSLRVQLCGDAHLANFGLYATPDRNLIFDLNDFDETAKGPFEWDVKRLAASAVLCGRQNGHTARQAREAGVAAAAAYRGHINRLAATGPLDAWYERLLAEDLLIGAEQLGPRAQRLVESIINKARSRTSAGALPKLTAIVDGERRMVSEPPHITAPVEDLREFLATSLTSYRRSIAPEIRALLGRFDVLDVARKVVGVGSVGLRAWVILLMADDQPLFLQIKEARASVVEPYAGSAGFRHAGQRVVVGQRTMQAASDLFLGWLTTPIGEEYYVRQLRDMKGSVPLELLRPPGLVAYAGVCGATLARAHARSGDAVAIAGYVGRGTSFDEVVGSYAVAYADQAERDFERFRAAIDAGRIEHAEPPPA